MKHVKTWACEKPDGDGCDGNHHTELDKAAERYAMEAVYPGVPQEDWAIHRKAFKTGATWQRERDVEIAKSKFMTHSMNIQGYVNGYDQAIADIAEAICSQTEQEK